MAVSLAHNADAAFGESGPQPHRLVVTAGGEAGAVGVERQTGHRVGVAGQWVADRVSGGRVPQPHRVVGTAGGDARAVGAAVMAQVSVFAWVPGA